MVRYRKLGSSNLSVSVSGLGGNTFGPPRLDKGQSVACIRRARDLGVNFIDTANIYGEGLSEEHVGAAIKGHREEWVIATKFNLLKLGANESVGEHIKHQCDDSLRKLGTDYIDLYQIHMPAAATPVEQILQALADLVRAGKVRWVGSCNYASWRHAEALDAASRHDWPPMISAQNHYNLLRRHVELETLPFCTERGVGFLPYHPLAGGFLTDKYVSGKPAPAGTRGAAGSPIVKRSRTARNEALQSALKEWAHGRGHSLAELAVAWLLASPSVASVIAGVSSPAQVEENVRASEWVLSEAERLEVDAIASWDGSSEKIELVLERR